MSKKKVLFDGRIETVWIDAKGTMWKHSKETYKVYEDVDGQWELIKGALITPDELILDEIEV